MSFLRVKFSSVARTNELFRSGIGEKQNLIFFKITYDFLIPGQNFFHHITYVHVIEIFAFVHRRHVDEV